MGIYEPQAFAGLTEIQIAERVSRHGHNPQKVVELPHATYENHKNTTDLVLGFVTGSAEIKVGDKVYHVVGGDKMNIPGGRPHSANVGAEGIVYYVTQCENCTD